MMGLLSHLHFFFTSAAVAAGMVVCRTLVALGYGATFAQKYTGMVE